MDNQGTSLSLENSGYDGLDGSSMRETTGRGILSVLGMDGY